MGKFQFLQLLPAWAKSIHNSKSGTLLQQKYPEKKSGFQRLKKEQGVELANKLIRFMIEPLSDCCNKRLLLSLLNQKVSNQALIEIRFLQHCAKIDLACHCLSLIHKSAFANCFCPPPHKTPTSSPSKQLAGPSLEGGDQGDQRDLTPHTHTPRSRI